MQRNPETTKLEKEFSANNPTDLIRPKSSKTLQPSCLLQTVELAASLKTPYERENL
jgi:hypothetical protein